MSSDKKYRRVSMNGEFEDVDFDPFISPDEIRQKSSDEFRKEHHEHMKALTDVLRGHGEALKSHGELLKSLHEHMTTPKRIIRDQQGRAIGMESVHDKGRN